MDKEGFSIIPEDHHNHLRDKDGSSSDSESGMDISSKISGAFEKILFLQILEDDQPQKIKVEIKPLSQDTLHKSSASIDELRDAIGNMSCSNSSNVSMDPGSL